MQIIVLGCHRSGTSACMRLLNMMGASLGDPDSLKASNRENPKGFWENDEVVDLNKLLLQQAGCRWDRVSTLSESHARHSFEHSEASLGRETERLILRFDVARPWATKDPRLCLTFPFWRKYLEIPRVVIVHRHPLEVARSLARRNPVISEKFGVALWEKYTLDALRYSIDLPRVLITHDHLLRDPAAVVDHLLERFGAMGVTGLHRPSNEEICRFIDPSLHRERVQEDSEHAGLSEAQWALHQAMESGDALQWTAVPEVSEKAQSILQEYEQATDDHPERLLANNRWNLARLLDTRDEVTRLRRQVRAEEARAAKALEKVAALEEREKELRDEIQESAQQAKESRRKHAEAVAQHDALRAKYSERCDREAAYRDDARQLRKGMKSVYDAAQEMEGTLWWRLGVRLRLLLGVLGLRKLRTSGVPPRRAV